MSLEFNSDKQRISSQKPILLGTEDFTIRSGIGSDEKEVLRVQLDPVTQLPRVGVNRTGRKVEKITVTAPGQGYTTTPSVTLSAPDLPLDEGGIQATASTIPTVGAIVAVVVDNPGFGYLTAPTVTISGGNGFGAQAEAFLDEIAFEFDVNGAIRTSTSIISDTARILNLDIDNFVTADAKFRAPNFKIYQNASGTQWSPNVTLFKDDFVYLAGNVYRALNDGVTGTTAPVHIDGDLQNGQVTLRHEGYREDSPLLPYYGQTGDGIFPRSVTPLLGDKSTKVATTEYVLNLATNDVGGRVYVSEQIGNDENDGRSAAAPVRSIKRACQIASQSVGVKESVIIAGGNYQEDNPISIPSDCSIVGDNLRLVIIRPRNPRKHMFKFGDKNYITGITFRDSVDSLGDSEFTWDFAVTFDDKQRVYYDPNSGGDFGRRFPIGHQIFGPPRIRVNFGSNTGTLAPIPLQVGTLLRGENTGARGEVLAVTFEETTGQSAYVEGSVDVNVLSGSFNLGETFEYYNVTDYTPTNVTYDPATGNAVFTIANHGFGIGDQILLSPESIAFTCSLDNNSSVHRYPRAAGADGQPDFAYKRWLSISAVTTNTFTCDVGGSTDLSTHTFVSADANAVKYAEAATTVEPIEFNDLRTFVSLDIISIRAEGEVISTGVDTTKTTPIVQVEIDPSYYTDPDIGGVICYTNTLDGGEANTRLQIHNFKENEEITITNMPTSGPDLSALNGKQRVYKVLYDNDGRSRRFVIAKDISSPQGITQLDNCTVASASHYLTLSLLNSPNKFSEAAYVERRYQDASNLLRNNTDFIADEVVRQINDEFAQKWLTAQNVSGTTFEVYTTPNAFAHTYVSGGTVTYGGTAYNIDDFDYDNATGVGTITTVSPIPGLTSGETVKVENILLSCIQGEKLYPGFNIPNGDSKCYRDVKHFVNAIIMDLEYGGNYHTMEAAKRYVDGTQIGYINNEIVETVRAYDRARELCILAVRNWHTGSGLYSEPVFVPRYSSVQRYTDPYVTEDTAGGLAGGTCANVVSAIETLGYLFTDIISNQAASRYQDASYLIARNIDLIAEEALADALDAYPSLGLNYPDRTKCKRDIKYILAGLRRDLILGGNVGMVTAGNFYYSGGQLTGVPASELPATRYAFTRARDYAINAMRNWTGGNYLGTTPTNATYDSTTGQVSVTIPTPNNPVTINDRIAFKEGALTFNCTSNGGGNLASPSPTDRNNGKSQQILSVSSNGGLTTITCNVGNAGTAAGVTHSFVSALANGTIVIYDPVSVNSTVDKFEDWNITIDPSASPAKAQITPTTASYDPATGNFVVTSAGHNVTTADSIIIKPESFVFTCTMDGNKTEHKYPQSGHSAFGNQINVTATTTNTFTVNVGASGPNESFTPTDATYDPATGDLVLTIGTHTLSVDEGITIDDNSLTFTCDMDNNQSQKTYPRPGIDPYAGRSIPIRAVTSDTITVNVGASGPNKSFTPSFADYNPSTGDLDITIGQHGLGVGRSVTLLDNSFAFTCALDGNNSTHTYPRPGVDPYADSQSIEITAVGSTSHTPTDAPYDAETGIVTFTVASHGFSNGDYIKIADNSLTYTCVLDGNVTQKTYPRAGYDYPSGRWLQISNVTTNTFKVDIGGSTYTEAHTFVSAAANAIERQNGIITINVGTSSDTSVHTFVSAAQNAVRHEPQSAHTFITASSAAIKHLPQSVHTFVRVEGDEPISVYGAGAAPACADVAAAITTSFETLDDILAGGSVTQTYGTLYEPNPTLPTEAILYDADNKFITPRGVWDDLPYIEASPYIQNSSIISFLGGNGCEIDGDKVAQPNCPFPGIEEDGSASNPNQGKSMVAAAFTIVSFGGTGYKVINDGYTQLVSVFVIFCQDGVFCDTGGYASITNSATNFGTFALRANGYRKDPYPFDVGTITGVSAATGTGFTSFTVQLLGREPLEHYIVKIDGYESENPDVDYFIDNVGVVTSGPPFTATFNLNQAAVFRDKSTGNVVNTDLGTLGGATIRLHRPSIVNSSSHTWEFAGAGTDYNALPENGGTKIEANEQVSENYGRVYTSGTDELGDFKVGYFAKIENRTGAITFTGTVTISEVEFLKLKGGDVVVTGFSDDNTLGGATASDSIIPTQKAVKDYITNNLGPYINKAYSTNPVPRALVELTDSGKISIDQIPALRPFSVYTVVNETERLKLIGALAGDIAIQQNSDVPNGTPQSFILNNDNDSLFLGFLVNPALDFGATGGIFTGSITDGIIQSTEYRQGVLFQLSIDSPGSGYTSAPTITISSPSSGVTAAATCTIANGQVVSITIIESQGYVGGYGYTTAPTITFSAPPAGGTLATAIPSIESRLYGDIVNNVKIVDTDTIDDVNSVTVDIIRVVNTSATDINNWVALSSDQIAANQITSGVIATARLANDSDAANSFTFLRGDQSYAPAVQTLKTAETRYFYPTFLAAANGASKLTFATNAKAELLVGHTVSSDNSGIDPNTSVDSITDKTGYIEIDINNPTTQAIPAGTFIEFERPIPPIIVDTLQTKTQYVDEIIITNAGAGFTPNLDLKNVGPLQGGSGTGLYANFTTDGSGTISSVTVTNGGGGFANDFVIAPLPAGLGNPTTAAILSAKVNTAIKGFGEIQLDLLRVTENTISADAYGTTGVAKFKKSQFNIGLVGDGSVELKTGSQSGLDADLLDGQQGSFYQNAFNISSGTLNKLRLSGSYDIDISGQSGNTLRLKSLTSNPTSDPTGDTFSEGAVINFINNSANGLADGGAANAVFTIRGKGSGATADGGVRQLAFTDNNNVWLRGTGSGVTTWTNWYKVWTELSDGPGTGLDADKLDNRQGVWFQDARNINFNQISDSRINPYLSQKAFQNAVTIRQVSNKTYYDIYISGLALTTTPFLNGQTVNLYDQNAQGVGTIVISNVNPFTSPDGDSTLNWTQITGYLNTGTFTGAETIGTASSRVTFQEYWINQLGTYEVGKLESNGGTAQLKLGRRDGTASNPSIQFNSSDAAAGYNSGIFASGGTATNGSGSLNVVVGGANNFTINNQTIWNAGNITFATNNVANTAVKRDASGNFAAGTITANLTGSASNNVLKTGDTMTGTLTINATAFDNQIYIQASNKFFTYNGGLQFRGSGSSWNARFSTTSTAGTELLGVYTTNFATAIFRVDNNRRTIFDLPANRSDAIIINGQSGGYSSIIHQNGGTTIGYRMAYVHTAGNYGSGTAVGDVVERLDGNRKWHFKTNGNNTALVMDASQNVAINQSNTNTSYKLYVNGAFGATSKSFVIPHPTKENYELRHGSLEGPEYGVYVRGKASDVIELPEYWTGLVDSETITVQLTPIGDHHAWVEKIEDSKVFIGGGEAFYFVQAERKDIDKLEVEFELPVEEEE